MAVCSYQLDPARRMLYIPFLTKTNATKNTAAITEVQDTDNSLVLALSRIRSGICFDFSSKGP